MKDKLASSVHFVVRLGSGKKAVKLLLWAILVKTGLGARRLGSGDFVFCPCCAAREKTK